MSPIMMPYTVTVWHSVFKDIKSLSYMLQMFLSTCSSLFVCLFRSLTFHLIAEELTFFFQGEIQFIDTMFPVLTVF